MFRIIEDTVDPVVKTYMDIIMAGCSAVDFDTKRIKYKQKAEKKAVIVSDTVLCALYYYFRGFRDHIVWIQGVIPEESFMRNKSRIRFAVLSLIEKFILKRAKLLFFVSEEMKKHYETKYKLSFEDRCIIMPCFNELKIDEKAFCLNNKYKNNSFVYVGSLSAWQCFDKTVELYKKVEDLSKENTILYVFTKEIDEAKAILSAYGVKNYHIDFVKSQDLGGVINQYKYGFVLRTDCTVNRVATPTKFSNYLAHGIIPIYSSCLNSFHLINQTLDIGIVSDVDNIDESAERIVNDMNLEYDVEDVRLKCKNAFDSYYNKDKYLPQICDSIRSIF